MEKKKVLILAVEHLPIRTNKLVAGGSMRSWYMAQGLRDQDLDVTVAIPYFYDLEQDEEDGIAIIKWEFSKKFVKTLNSFDTVIMQYSRGELVEYILQNISDKIQLVVDMYVPLYIEIAARDSNEKELKYVQYMAELRFWNLALRRGDIFLYANDNQKLLYQGVLSSQGRINSFTYRQHILVKYPLGYSRKEPVETEKPFKGKIVGEDDFVVLWFGGLYPWFDIGELIAAVDELHKDNPRIKLLLLGGKNPFQEDKALSHQYDKTIEHIKKIGALDTSVFLQDWVPFDERVNWFKSSDLIVSFNKEGDENVFSWRTRIVDFIWSESIILSNGGDPVTDELLKNNAAAILNSLDKDSIKKVILELMQNPNKFAEIRKNLMDFKPSLYNDVVAKELALRIDEGFRADDLQYKRTQAPQNSGREEIFLFRRFFFREFSRFLEQIDIYGLKKALIILWDKAQGRTKKLLKKIGGRA